MTEPTGTRMDLFEWARVAQHPEDTVVWVLHQRNLPDWRNTAAAIYRQDAGKYDIVYLHASDANVDDRIARVYGIESESLAKETIETLINLNIAKERTP